MDVAIVVVLILIIVVLLFALGRTQASLSAKVEEARRDAIGRSRAVLGGRFTEQMAPYLPEFRYDPTEARFIGSPVDLVVFPGLSSDQAARDRLRRGKGWRSGPPLRTGATHPGARGGGEGPLGADAPAFREALLSHGGGAR